MIEFDVDMGYLLEEGELDCIVLNDENGEHEPMTFRLGSEINGDTSDGYHTFDELYHHRAVLFSVIVANYRDKAWKSRKHYDGTMYDGMFIVGIDTPWGQASYHYDIDPYWDTFDCEALEHAPEWDGHTPGEAIERIGKLATLGGGECEGSKERLQNMLGEMKKLASDGRREWCGRSHGEYGIFVGLEDFAMMTEQRMDEPWMWGSRI